MVSVLEDFQTDPCDSGLRRLPDHPVIFVVRIDPFGCDFPGHVTLQCGPMLALKACGYHLDPWLKSFLWLLDDRIQPGTKSIFGKLFATFQTFLGLLQGIGGSPPVCLCQR